MSGSPFSSKIADLVKSSVSWVGGRLRDRFLLLSTAQLHQKPQHVNTTGDDEKSSTFCKKAPRGWRLPPSTSPPSTTAGVKHPFELSEVHARGLIAMDGMLRSIRWSSRSCRSAADYNATAMSTPLP
jgi:hypothetical protein